MNERVQYEEKKMTAYAEKSNKAMDSCYVLVNEKDA